MAASLPIVPPHLAAIVVQRDEAGVPLRVSRSIAMRLVRLVPNRHDDARSGSRHLRYQRTGSAAVNFWIDSAPIEAAELVEQFHYSHRMPAAIQCIVTAHEDGGLYGDRGRAVAAVVFTIPPTRWSEDVWELARLVRRDDVKLPLTSMIGEACRIIRRRKVADLLISFADSTHGHHGGVYQAASWNFDGQRDAACWGVQVGAEYVPGRSANHRWGTRSAAKLQAKGVNAVEVWDTGKYLYWRALNRNGDKKAARLGLKSKAYPKPQEHP